MKFLLASLVDLHLHWLPSGSSSLAEIPCEQAEDKAILRSRRRLGGVPQTQVTRVSSKSSIRAERRRGGRGSMEETDSVPCRRAAACKEFKVGRDGGDQQDKPCNETTTAEIAPTGAELGEERHHAEFPNPAMAWRRRAPIWPPRELGRELGWRRRCRL
jgi:predicted Rdx family selenoprotein